MKFEELEDYNYKPLPRMVVVRSSDIHGKGIFAIKELKKNILIGISHVEDDSDIAFDHGLIRTPLGGFLNHSDDPNCMIYKLDKYHFLKTTKEIKVNEELLVDYSKWLCGNKKKNESCNG